MYNCIYLFFVLNYVVFISAAVFIPYYLWLILIAVPIIILQVRLGGIVNAGIVGIFSRNIPFLKGELMDIVNRDQWL